MDKTGKTIIGVFSVVYLLIFFREFHLHPPILEAMFGAMAVVTTIWLLYICIQLYDKFGNPYFKLTSVSYGLNLALPIVSNIASVGGILSLGRYIPVLNHLPLSTWAPWVNEIPILLVMYATLLYREGWEYDEGASILQRFYFLVPAAKTLIFWLILIGAPLAYYLGLGLIRFYILRVPTGIMDVLTQIIFMLITLLIVMLNFSLFRAYQTRFFKYMYVISVVTFIYSLAWGIVSLYTQWLVMAPQRHPVNFSILVHNSNFLNLIPTVYQLAILLFSAFVFLTYEESRTGGN